MCIKTISSGPLRLTSWGTGQMFHPVSAWLPATTMNGLQFDLLIRAIAGDSFIARPGYQFATVRPDVSEDPTTDFGWATTEGWHRFTTTPPTVSSRFLWRPGILYAVADGHSSGSADVQLETQFFGTSDVIGNQAVEIQPYNDTNNLVAVHPVTDWIASVHAKYLRAAIVVANNSTSTMQTQLMARWADDKAAPGATWAELEGGWNTPASGNSERNTGAIGPVTIQGSYLQVGIGIRKSTGNANRASIHVATILDRV